jgi:hypothetical protein
MRENISIKDTALIASVQVGVIFAGVIWASFLEKGFVAETQPEPQLLGTLAHFGLVALAIPPLWIALVLCSRHLDSVGIKISIFYFGLVAAAALALFVVYAVVCGYFALEPGYHLRFLH